MKYICYVLFFITSINIFSSPYKWKEYDTNRFKFIYQEKDEIVIRELLGYADKVYDAISKDFKVDLYSIPVILHASTNAANGFFSTLPSGVNLFLSPPTQSFTTESIDEGWMRRLFTHELTHYIEAYSKEGLFSFVEDVFNQPILSKGLLSSAFSEGVAVYYETILTKGGRGRSSFFDMINKAPILEDKMHVYEKAKYYSGAVYSNRVYNSGYLIVDYLMRHYGNDSFNKFKKQFSLWPFFGEEIALENIVGKSVNELWQDIINEKKEKYNFLKDIPLGSSFKKDNYIDYYGGIPTDKGILVYNSSGSINANLGFIKKDGTWETFKYLNLYDNDSFTSTPDGKNIYVTTVNQKIKGYNVEPELWGWNEEKDFYRINTEIPIWQVVISPNKKYLVGISYNKEYYHKLVSLNLETNEIKDLYLPQEYNSYIFKPMFSPDGKNIVFAQMHNASQNIIEINIDENGDFLELKDKKYVTNTTKSNSYYPKYIDNDTITFSSDIEGAIYIYAYHKPENKFSKLVEDKIGAWNYIEFNGKAIYNSYRTEGFILASQKIYNKEVENLNFFDTPYEPYNIEYKPLDKNLIHNYISFPLFRVWYLTGKVVNYSQNSSFAPGIKFMGVDYLGTQKMNLDTMYEFAHNQLFLDFLYSLNIGDSNNLSLSFNQSAKTDIVSKNRFIFYQTSNAYLALNSFFVDGGVPGNTNSVSMLNQFNYKHYLYSDKYFSIKDSSDKKSELDKKKIYSADIISLINKINYKFILKNRDPYMKNFKINLDVLDTFDVILPLKGAKREDFVYGNLIKLSFNVPIFIMFNSLMFETDFSYTSSQEGLNTNLLSSFGNNKSLFYKLGDVRLNWVLSWNMDFGPLDWSVLDLHILDLSSKVFVETGYNFDTSSKLNFWDDAIVLGFLLSTSFSYEGSNSFGFDIGFKYRVDFKTPEIDKTPYGIILNLNLGI